MELCMCKLGMISQEWLKMGVKLLFKDVNFVFSKFELRFLDLNFIRTSFRPMVELSLPCQLANFTKVPHPPLRKATFDSCYLESGR